MKLLSDTDVRLRALEPADVDALYAWENLSELWNTSATLAPYSRRNFQKYIETYDADPFGSGELRLMVECGSRPVGFVDLYGVEVLHRRAYIGILIAPDMQRRGYARRALALLERYCSRHLQLHQLLALVPVYNDVSLSLFASCGYTRVALLPDFIAVNRGFADAALMRKVL